VHPHLAEVVTKAALEEGASADIEWVARRAQNLMDNRRGFRVPCRGERGSPNGRRFALLRGLGANPLQTRYAAVRRAQHPVCDLIGILLVTVARLIYRQLRLKKGSLAGDLSSLAFFTLLLALGAFAA
jgi:hypothetical protein